MTKQSKRQAATQQGESPPSQADENARHQVEHDATYGLENHYKHYTAGSVDEIYFRLTRAVVLAARKWRKHANNRLRSIGQSQARWETLFIISFAGGRIAQRQLAKKLSIEAPTLVRMLDTLAKDGLIKRIPDENDKRVVHNELTDEGEKAVEQIKQLTNDLRLELLRGLSLPDMEVTQRVLYQLIMRLDEADED